MAEDIVQSICRRVFDSQNNARAGYNVGGPDDRKHTYFDIYNQYKNSTQSGIRARMEDELAPPGRMKYYEGMNLINHQSFELSLSPLS